MFQLCKQFQTKFLGKLVVLYLIWLDWRNKQKTYIFINSSVSVGQILLHLNCLVFLKSIMLRLETKTRRLLIIKEQGGKKVRQQNKMLLCISSMDAL